jgi:predicted deacylase
MTRWIRLFLCAALLVITGCNYQSSLVNNPQEPFNQGAPHAFRLLPPAWTPTANPYSLKNLTNPYSPSPTPRIETAQTSPTPSHLNREALIIGYSVEGRPLEVFTFGNGQRDIMIVAGIHGGYEWNTIALADKLISFLDENPDMIPKNITLHILRALNPDGAALTHGPMGRGNANGVDLNRNWNSSWTSDIPKPNCWDIVPLTAGPYPGSEPETQALMRYVVSENIKALISYHSASLGIFAGGKPPSEDSLALAEAIAAVCDYPYPPIDIGCEYTGTLTDWMTDAGIPAIDIELSTHWDTDFEQNLRILQTFLEWRP